MRTTKLDDLGDLHAEKGSRSWAIAVRNKIVFALRDEASAADSLRRWIHAITHNEGWRQLANVKGKPFVSFESFCTTAQPFGLGYAPDHIQQIVAEKRGRGPAGGACGEGGDAVSDSPLPPTTTPIDYALAARRALPSYKPFPVELLPAEAEAMVRGAAESVRVDMAFAALPALAAMAGAVGNARRLVLKKGRAEPAVLWCAVVAKSGTGKTPAAKLILDPLYKLHGRLLRDHAEAMAEHERERLEHERDLAAWRKTKPGSDADGAGGGGPPDAPEPPPMRRVMVDDTTTEALAPILLDNPRGVLLAADELRAWLGTFDRYSAKGGGDMARWLSMHSASSISVDRKTGTPRTLYVPSAAVSVTGGIQPGIMRSAMTGEHYAAGLGARLLLAAPPIQPRRWSDAEVPDDVSEAWAALLDRLASLPMTVDAEGQPQSVCIGMNHDAKRAFAKWHDEHYAMAEGDDDDLAAAMSKIETAGARFALLAALADDAERAEECHVERACGLADWFAGEARRVYAMLGESAGQSRARELAEAVRRDFAGDVRVRDWQRKHHRRLKSADDARAELQGLAEAGHGELFHATGANTGGRPAERFRLLDTGDSGDGDKTTADDPPTGVLSPSPVSPPGNADPDDTYEAEERAAIQGEPNFADELYRRHKSNGTGRVRGTI